MTAEPLATPCNRTANRWRILSREELARRYPGWARVAIAECCGAA